MKQKQKRCRHKWKYGWSMLAKKGEHILIRYCEKCYDAGQRAITQPSLAQLWKEAKKK